MSRSYRHLMQSDGSYTVLESREDGTSRIVATDHPTYLAWLAAGGEPAVVAYVAPAALDLTALKERAVREVQMAVEQARLAYYPVHVELDIRRLAPGHDENEVKVLNTFIDEALRSVQAQAVLEIMAAESADVLPGLVADYHTMLCPEATT